MYSSRPVEVVRAKAAMVCRGSAGSCSGSGGGGSGGSFFLFSVLITFLVVFSMQSTMVEAKRGCANFGHSCYGGMGKRNLNEEYASQETNQVDEINPGLVFTGPRSIPQISDQRRYHENKMAAADKMAPYFQQLLRLYRNMQRQEQNQLETSIEK